MHAKSAAISSTSQTSISVSWVCVISHMRATPQDLLPPARDEPTPPWRKPAPRGPGIISHGKTGGLKVMPRFDAPFPGALPRLPRKFLLPADGLAARTKSAKTSLYDIESFDRHLERQQRLSAVSTAERIAIERGGGGRLTQSKSLSALADQNLTFMPARTPLPSGFGEPGGKRYGMQACAQSLPHVKLPHFIHRPSRPLLASRHVYTPAFVSLLLDGTQAVQDAVKRTGEPCPFMRTAYLVTA